MPGKNPGEAGPPEPRVDGRGEAGHAFPASRASGERASAQPCPHVASVPVVPLRARFAAQFILQSRRFRLGRRKIPRLYFRLKIDPFVAAIAKRLVLRIAAAAKTDSRATSQAEGFTLEVVNRKFALDTERAMIRHNDFGFCQANLPRMDRQGRNPVRPDAP